MKAPSARSTASSSILPRSAASTIGTRCAGFCSSLKPVCVRSPFSATSRKSSVSRTLLSGRSKGIPFQPSTIRSEEAPRPSTKRPAGGVGERRRLLRQQRRAALEDADDPGPQPRPLGPGRAQRQRREAVGPRGLARPEVGVAGRLGAPDQLLVVSERQSRQRQRQAPAIHRRGPYRRPAASLRTSKRRCDGHWLKKELRVLGAERPGEEEALAVVALFVADQREVLRALDPLGASSRSPALCRAGRACGGGSRPRRRRRAERRRSGRSSARRPGTGGRWPSEE